MNSNEYDAKAELLLRTTDKTNQHWHLYASNQVCQGTSQEAQDGRRKRNEDSYASNNMSWIGQGIQQSGHSQYKAMIGSLLYLISSSLDILFNVGLCGRF